MADKTIGIEASDGNFYNVKLRDMGGGLWAPVNSASISDFPALQATQKADHVSIEGQDATYSIMFILTPDSTTSGQVILGLEASATMDTTLLRLRIWPTQTTAAIANFWLRKNTTLATGGTSTTQSPARRRTTDPVFTALVRGWTAKPTAQGTLDNYIGTFKGTIPAVAGSTIAPEVVMDWDYREPGGRRWFLPANSTEAIYLYGPAAAVQAGLTFVVVVDFMESAP